MTYRVGDTVIFDAEPERACELCGKVAETRPYGPGGKRICFECGKKDPEGTKRRMDKALFGERPDPDMN